LTLLDIAWHCLTLLDIAWHFLTFLDIAWHCLTCQKLCSSESLPLSSLFLMSLYLLRKFAPFDVVSKEKLSVLCNVATLYLINNNVQRAHVSIIQYCRGWIISQVTQKCCDSILICNGRSYPPFLSSKQERSFVQRHDQDRDTFWAGRKRRCLSPCVVWYNSPVYKIAVISH